ncbi:MAG TPA: transcriptional regulator [Vicinamibacterales bacterium]|jgi:DNA-binding winged helix-turn-helix (wHTH) protein|nr:transcriptional regulator [Vicinamibacterales bacterium]
MATIRFGAFALDTRSGELRRAGLRVRLRPQPCAVLTYLAEHSGTFVSRQELHRHLWREGTFVHFDQGLNSCIKQVRRAIGDNRRVPTYIETLPRRGYRFLATVQIEDADPPSESAAGVNGDLISRLAQAVARELSAALPVTNRSADSIELADVQDAARRALAATLNAGPETLTGAKGRQRVW